MEGGKRGKGKEAADGAKDGGGGKSQDNGGSGAVPTGNITVNNNADTVAIFYPSPGVYNFHQHSHGPSGQEQTISSVGFRAEDGLGRIPFGGAIERRQLLNSIGVVADIFDRRASFPQLPPLAIGQPMEVDSESSVAKPEPVKKPPRKKPPVKKVAAPAAAAAAAAVAAAVAAASSELGTKRKAEGGPPEESAGKTKTVLKRIKRPIPMSSGGDDGDGSSGKAHSKQVQKVSPVQSTSKKAHPFDDIDEGENGDVDTSRNNDDSQDSDGGWETVEYK